MNDGDCCIKSWIGNRICDVVNNFSSCGNYDGRDCRPPNITEWPGCPHNPGLIGDGTCDYLLKNAKCNHDALDCCKKPDLVGNGQCDEDLEFDIHCRYDNGDCLE